MVDQSSISRLRDDLLLSHLQHLRLDDLADEDPGAVVYGLLGGTKFAKPQPLIRLSSGRRLRLDPTGRKIPRGSTQV